MASAPDITAFFDEVTNSVSYLVADAASGAAAVIDPALDFDAALGTVETRPADKILSHAKDRGLTIAWVLETHVHADHLSAASVIRDRTRAKVGIGAGISEVQRVFASMLGIDDLNPEDFDRLLEDGDRVPLGEF